MLYLYIRLNMVDLCIGFLNDINHMIWVISGIYSLYNIGVLNGFVLVVMDMICRTFQMLLAWKDPYSGYYEFTKQNQCRNGEVFQGQAKDIISWM